MITQRLLTPAEVEAMTHAEESLLGALLIDASDDDSRSIIDQCAMIVKPSDFFGWNDKYQLTKWQPLNARIYGAMLACKDPPHVVNVPRQMIMMGLAEPGMLAHFSHCVAECPTCLDWNDYAVAVRYYSQSRRSVVVEDQPYKGLKV